LFDTSGNRCIIYAKLKKGEIMPRRTNIYLPEEQIKRLKDISKKKDISVSEIIRRAIDEYLRREEKKV